MNIFLRHTAWTVFLGFISAASLSQAAEPTLCKASETPIFSCKLKNTKTVSVCASSHSTRSYVDYRFGKISKVELTYSANDQIPDHKFHRGEVVYANNSDDILWFTSGKYRYSIYSPTRGGPGLSVSLHGDVVSRIECSNSGSGATEGAKAPSPFIIEHGTGGLTTFEKLRGE